MNSAQHHLKIWLSLALLLSLGFVWGTGYSIARFAMTHGVNPLGYSFWQSVGPAVLISLLVLASKEKLTVCASHYRYYFICSLTGIVIPNTNMYFAAPHLPAGLLAVVVNTVPILAYPIALIAQSEFFQWQRFIAVLLALAGLMFILLPDASLPSRQMVPWALLALLTPLCFAFCSVYISRFRPPNSSSLSLAAGTLLFSSLLLSPVVLGSGNFYTLHFPLTLPDKAIVLEILLSSVGYVLFFNLIKIAGPVYYSFVDAIVALTGLFWGYMIFHEKLNFYNGTAVLLILCALILITKCQQRMI